MFGNPLLLALMLTALVVVLIMYLFGKDVEDKNKFIKFSIYLLIGSAILLYIHDNEITSKYDSQLNIERAKSSISGGATPAFESMSSVPVQPSMNLPPISMAPAQSVAPNQYVPYGITQPQAMMTSLPSDFTY